MNVIDKAIERLAGNWKQGDYGDWRGDGPVCALGAFAAASGITESINNRHPRFDELDPAYTALVRTFEDEVDCYVADFNDDASTTESDVILLMKKASARLDEEEAGA